MKSSGLIGGKYRLLRTIGKGAMGTVWAAVNDLTSREVAIKLITESTEDLRVRLMREAKACGSLSHRNIIEVLDVGRTDSGDPFLVMPLLQGETLAERLERLHRVDPVTAAQIARDIARALAAAHRMGIVHRDLKPANIFLHNEAGSEGFVVKVLDFGVSKNLNAQEALATMLGSAVGSPAYMSPEQIQQGGTADALSDLWSLGVVFFEMLTGQRPFQGDAVQVLRQVTIGEIPRVSKYVWRIDAALDQLVSRCLQRDRVMRIQSAETVAKELEAYLGHETSRITDTNPAPAISASPADTITKGTMAMPDAPLEVAAARAAFRRTDPSKRDPFAERAALLRDTHPPPMGANENDEDPDIATVPLDLDKVAGFAYSFHSKTTQSPTPAPFSPRAPFPSAPGGQIASPAGVPSTYPSPVAKDTSPPPMAASTSGTIPIDLNAFAPSSPLPNLPPQPIPAPPPPVSFPGQPSAPFPRTSPAFQPSPPPNPFAYPAGPQGTPPPASQRYDGTMQLPSSQEQGRPPSVDNYPALQSLSGYDPNSAGQDRISTTSAAGSLQVAASEDEDQRRRGQKLMIAVGAGSAVAVASLALLILSSTGAQDPNKKEPNAVENTGVSAKSAPPEPPPQPPATTSAAPAPSTAPPLASSAPVPAPPPVTAVPKAPPPTPTPLKPPPPKPPPPISTPPKSPGGWKPPPKKRLIGGH